MQEKRKLPTAQDGQYQHYSNRGGHKQRSIYWDGNRPLSTEALSVHPEIAWRMRRRMFRDPNSGR